MAMIELIVIHIPYRSSPRYESVNGTETSVVTSVTPRAP
jgi:hypothetical protein